MKNQYRMVSRTVDVTKFSDPVVVTDDETGASVAQNPEPLEGTTTFKVELSQVDINNVNQVVGTVYVTLDYLTDYTGQAKLDIEAKLAEQGLLDGAESDVLEQAKQQRWARLIAVRDGLELKGFNYMGKTFDSDERSTLRLFGITQAAMVAKMQEREFTVEWTTADNSILTMTVDEILGIPAAMAANVNKIHAQARELKGRLDMAGSIAEVQSVLWPNVEIEIHEAI